MYRFRMLASNYRYMQDHISKFIYTTVVQNRCDKPYDLPVVLQQSPRTHVIHGKFMLLDPTMQIVHRVFQTVLGRTPTSDEEKLVGARVRHREWSELYLCHVLCTDITWQFTRITKDVDWDAAGLACAAAAAEVASYTARDPRAHAVDKAGEVEDSQRGLPSSDSAEPRELVGPWSSKSKENALYFWSSDLHSGPAHCNADLFAEMGHVSHIEVSLKKKVRFFFIRFVLPLIKKPFLSSTQVDHPTCEHHGVCRRRLKVLRWDNWRGFSLSPCPNSYKRAFFEAYKNDDEMERVDAVFCSHPAANCELYMPLNRSLIVYATTRLEFGRAEDEFIDWRKPDAFAATAELRWNNWIGNVRAIASKGHNIVLANNRYDQHYIYHFTNVRPLLLPSWCGREHLPRYAPSKREIIIGPSRDNLDIKCEKWSCDPWQHPLMLGLKASIDRKNSDNSDDGADRRRARLKFLRLKDAYAQFTLADLTRHPALVIMPYQASVISVFEMYRMGVPLFAPSKHLLLNWHIDYDILWERRYGQPQQPDFVRVEQARAESEILPDPNSDKETDVRHWLDYHDIYNLPHVQMFDSWDDLTTQLSLPGLTERLWNISRSMMRYNEEVKAELKSRWNIVFNGLQTGKQATEADFSDFFPRMTVSANMGTGIRVGSDMGGNRGGRETVRRLSRLLPRSLSLELAMLELYQLKDPFQVRTREFWSIFGLCTIDTFVVICRSIALKKSFFACRSSALNDLLMLYMVSF